MSNRFQHFYLIELQYLGFRLHGWQFQKGLKTVQGFLERTIKFVLGEQTAFKIMGSGRTDAMVSALSSYFELFLENPIDEICFFRDFNANLPADLKLLSWKKVDSKFNILHNVEHKTYNYFFASGEKQHPFSAPFLTCIHEELDVPLMKKGAALFEGVHDFVHYCYRPIATKETMRTLHSCKIVENTELKANFFPEQTYILEIVGKGFMRYQIRLMMGALFLLGRNEINLTQIDESLKGNTEIFKKASAPASALMVKSTQFN
jgi:tRNA pseudouridine38-40 synthase